MKNFSYRELGLTTLRSRVFLATASVAILTIGVGTQFVTDRISREAESELGRNLSEAALLVESQYATRMETLNVLGSLIADLPKLKAAVATKDTPTISPVAHEYRELVDCDVLILTDSSGHQLARSGEVPVVFSTHALEGIAAGESVVWLAQGSGDALEMVTHPIVIGPEPVEILGSLSLGFLLNEARVAEYRALSQSEVIIATPKVVLGASLNVGTADWRAALEDPSRMLAIGDEEYLLSSRTLSLPGDETGIVAVVLRSRSEHLSFLTTFQQGVILSAVFGVLLAVLLSYGVARTVTRPLSAISGEMRDMTESGDFSRRIELPRGSDVEATVLASAFNRLIDAIHQFQSEFALKERLSSLGQMSTVLAHEIRNPLMIIKTAVRGLRSSGASPVVQEAADDIDNEVARLNRMVGSVMDFARPVQVDWHEVDVNRIVSRIAGQFRQQYPAVFFETDLDRDLAPIQSDEELLLSALANIVNNAVEAVGESEAIGRHDASRTETGGAPSPRVYLRSSSEGSNLCLAVEDSGPGIAADELEKIFEPYFTSKRSGTGLGLAITKNIVASLAGRVWAEPGERAGTRIVVELPRARAASNE